MEKRRNILLCVAGLTPQIIMETLYALTQRRGERIDEIRVITTIAGRNLLMDVLVNPQSGKLAEFCNDYGIDRQSIKFDETTITLLRTPDGLMLDDIRTEEENEYAGDQICEIVRALTGDSNTRIHASAAGGRKTMSIYLTAAMQMFGRAQDRLSHVLVSEAFETNREFFYRPPVARMLKDRNQVAISTDEAEIYLADIPFIRLRGTGDEWQRLSQEAHRYGDMVANAQKYLDFLESEYDLEIDLENNQIKVLDTVVTLTPKEMFFYAMFAEFRQQERNGDGIVSLFDLTEADFETTFRRVTNALEGEASGLDRLETFDEYDFIKTMWPLILSRTADGMDLFRKKFHPMITRIKTKFLRKRIPERYSLIHFEDEKRVSCYYIPVSPRHIKFKGEPTP